MPNIQYIVRLELNLFFFYTWGLFMLKSNKCAGRKSPKKRAYLLPQCKYDKFTLLEDKNYILNNTCEFILVGKKEEGSRGVKYNHRRNFTE